MDGGCLEMGTPAPSGPHTEAEGGEEAWSRVVEVRREVRG